MNRGEVIMSTIAVLGIITVIGLIGLKVAHNPPAAKVMINYSGAKR